MSLVSSRHDKSGNHTFGHLLPGYDEIKLVSIFIGKHKGKDMRKVIVILFTSIDTRVSSILHGFDMLLIRKFSSVP